MSDTVVQWSELLSRENKPGSTPGGAVFCFFFCLIFVF